MEKPSQTQSLNADRGHFEDSSIGTNLPRGKKEMLGEDLEDAYGRVLFDFGGIAGGLRDGGKDFVTEKQDMLPSFQIKSSWDGKKGAKEFLARSLKFNRFIPVAVGEPGTPQEIIDSIKEFGGWVEKDEQKRQDYLAKIQKVRDTIAAGDISPNQFL